MSKNRARDRAARAAMDESGAFRARAVRQVDTTGKSRKYPVRLVDAHGQSWYLNSGQTNAYGTRSLHYSETRTYEQIVEEYGPVRHIDVPADGDTAAIRQALQQAGPKALATLTAALHAAATACEHATGRPEDLVAGRPGSTESTIVLSMTLDAGPKVPAASVDAPALEAVAGILTRWVTGETVVELAENLAWTLGPLVDELGWTGLTDPWARQHLAPYASWVTGHSNDPAGALRARDVLDEDEEAVDLGAQEVGQVAFLLDASIPVEPDPSLVGDATMEELLAALVARSIHTLERDGTEYPARADVFVMPPASNSSTVVKEPGIVVNRPGDAPPGWRNVSAMVLVSTRRPWGLHDEDQRVITDAYRVAAAELNRYWPGLPEESQHAALSLDMLAALRGQFTADAVRELFRDMVQNAVHHTYTLGADPELEPGAGERP
ncbi:hypothetical protein ACIRJ3_32750 [Streptomyces anulatus]